MADLLIVTSLDKKSKKILKRSKELEKLECTAESSSTLTERYRFVIVEVCRNPGN